MSSLERVNNIIAKAQNYRSDRQAVATATASLRALLLAIIADATVPVPSIHVIHDSYDLLWEVDAVVDRSCLIRGFVDRDGMYSISGTDLETSSITTFISALFAYLQPHPYYALPSVKSDISGYLLVETDMEGIQSVLGIFTEDEAKERLAVLKDRSLRLSEFSFYSILYVDKDGCCAS